MNTFCIKTTKLLLIIILCCATQVAYCDHKTDSIRKLADSQPAEEKAKTLVDLYLAFYNQNELASSLNILDEIIGIRQSIGDIEGEASARWSRIALLNNAACFKQLAKEADIQMSWFKEHKMWDRYYQVWQRKCSAYHDQGKVQTSLHEARIMKEDAERRDNKTGRAMAYKQMGVVYYDLQQFGQAGEAFKHSIHYLLEEKNTTGMVSGLYDFQCKVFDKQQKYQEEKDSTDSWLKHLKILGKLNGENLVNGPYCSAWVARASAFMGLGQIDSTIAAMNKAEAYYRKYPTSLCKFYLYSLYTRLNMAKGQYEQALAYTDSLKDIEEGPTNSVLIIRAETLIKLGRAEEAVVLYQQLCQQQDSIYSREMRMQLDELNTLFHVDELKMQRQLDRQRSVTGAAILVLFTLIWIGLSHIKASRRLKREHELLMKSNNKLEKSYKELSKANALVEESSRMKTNFIHQVSHEIRTPLNVISGFTQIIATPGIQLDDATKQDISQRITENTDRITGLVKKMLELSEDNSQAVIPCEDNVSVMQIAIQAFQESGIEMAGHLTFNLQITPEVETFVLHTNVQQVVRALSLLLDNAQKYTKEGSVTLNASLINENKELAFCIEDTGIGVPAEEAEHIFDEFVQLDEFYDGTGIGLTISRSIARRLGGDVILDTTYSGGARFIMTIPTINS